MIILASAGIGAEYGKGLKEHLEELRFLRQFIRMLAGELKYTKEPLPDALMELSGRIKEPYASFFREACEELERKGNLVFPEWFREKAKEKLFAVRREKKLTKEEWELFLSFGNQIGYMDIEMQLNALFSYEERWELHIRKAEEEIAPKRRIANCLGILTGVFLTVLFL